MMETIKSPKIWGEDTCLLSLLCGGMHFENKGDPINKIRIPCLRDQATALLGDAVMME